MGSQTRAAGDRDALDRLCADLLATCAQPSPSGLVTLALDTLRRAPPSLAVRALGCAVTTVSGAPYSPRLERLERLAERLLRNDSTAGTLGGCRVVPLKDERLLVCREPAAASHTLALSPGESALWDRRFVVALGRSAGQGPFSVRRLGRDGLARARALSREPPALHSRTDRVPAPARPSLPALFDLDGPLAAPHLGFKRTLRRHENDKVKFSALVSAGTTVGCGAPGNIARVAVAG